MNSHIILDVSPPGFLPKHTSMATNHFTGVMVKLLTKTLMNKVIWKETEGKWSVNKSTKKLTKNSFVRMSGVFMHAK